MSSFKAKRIRITDEGHMLKHYCETGRMLKARPSSR